MRGPEFGCGLAQCGACTVIINVACVVYEGTNGYAALIAEVEVDRATGRVFLTRYTVALDCGPVSNPNGLSNQIEGGLLLGTSRAMLEEVRWNDRQVTSTTWATYDTLTLGFDAPEVSIVNMNPTGCSCHPCRGNSDHIRRGRSW